jgi:toxin ParE1/3/4
MRLVVDATAWRDLDDIGQWIAKDSPAAARRVLETILQAIQILAHFPLLARPGRARNSYESRVIGTPYIIVFQLWEKPAAIVVVAVVHAARDR